ncbi:Ig-like domain-containing protein [Polaribacter sp. MED152]|uniref:Ig-like domain-containing protein n=1 Tax=Polaribacter sp. MED152 TaxID=313598 RepID=UPI000068CC64|nr:Ig-like domain-containing protein [Polaribacter sp. MED152]EAQ43218.1 glycosyl hydrolase family 16 [Polaribacter sp. MED152]
MTTTLPNACKLYVYKKYILITCILLTTVNSLAQFNPESLTYFEDFDNPGYPANTPTGAYWSFYNEIHPNQDSWNKFIPGDGNAYIQVDADITNDLDWIHPFQTLIFGGVAENHRLEVRMKGAVVDGGLVGFLFTYNQEGIKFNEVDIEVVANDSATPSHETLPENNGWTDARFNTWRNANENSARPFTGTKKAIINDNNEKISLIDDQFHTYTIDWRADRIDFFIDNVLQETITTNIATGKSEVIFGFRQLPWANDFNWSGTQTMVIDYLKIEPIEVETFAANDNFITEFNTPIDLDVLENDTKNTAIISFDNNSVNGNLITESNNVLTFTPASGFSGNDSFTYTLEDSEGVQATATVTVKVNERPLEAADDAITINVGSSDIAIDVLANDFYGEFGENPTHPLTLPGGKTATASDNGALISVYNGKVYYTAPANFAGIDTFVYTITDANGYADTATVTITIGGDYPAEAANDNFSIDVDTATSLDVLVNDLPENVSIVSVDANSNQGFTLSIENSAILYTPTNGFIGMDEFTYTIEDADGNQSSAIVSLTVEPKTVNSSSLEAIDDTVSVNIGSENNVIEVLANDNYGVNGMNSSHPLTLTNGKLVTASNNGGTISVANGTVIYTTPLNFVGSDSFTYTITDAKGFADYATVNITVGGDLPADAKGDSYTIKIDESTSLDVLKNDFPTTATIVNFDNSSEQGFTISLVNSELVYEPINGFEGNDSFSYTIEDANGVQSTATVTLIVEEEIIESGPITAVNDTLALLADSSNISIDVLANDSFGTFGPNENHPLTLTNGKLSTESTNGGSIRVLNGNIEYSTPTGFTGIDTFEYTITDKKGFASKANVRITVTSEPLETKANNDTFTIHINSATALDVLENDITNDGTIIEYDALSTEGFTISRDNHLMVYAPTGDFEGEDSFTYTIEDNEGIQSTATVFLTVEEEVVQTGTVDALDDEITVTEKSEDILIDVTANDNYGANGKNSSHPLTLTNGKMVTASDNGGDIRVIDGQINYSTPANFVGTDTFTYTITDGNGFADSATVTITIVGEAASKNGSLNTSIETDSNLVFNEFDVYPNPSVGNFKSILFSDVNTKANLMISDITGKTLFSSAVTIQKGKNEFDFNLDLSSGVKFVRIVSSQVDFGIKKLIIK